MKYKKRLIRTLTVFGVVLALCFGCGKSNTPEISRTEFDQLQVESKKNSAWRWHYHGTDGSYHHFTIKKGLEPYRFKIKVQELQLNPGVEFALGSDEERVFKSNQVAP